MEPGPDPSRIFTNSLKMNFEVTKISCQLNDWDSNSKQTSGEASTAAVSISVVSAPFASASMIGNSTKLRQEKNLERNFQRSLRGRLSSLCRHCPRLLSAINWKYGILGHACKSHYSLWESPRIALQHQVGPSWKVNWSFQNIRTDSALQDFKEPREEDWLRLAPDPAEHRY